MNNSLESQTTCVSKELWPSDHLIYILLYRLTTRRKTTSKKIYHLPLQLLSMTIRHIFQVERLKEILCLAWNEKLIEFSSFISVWMIVKPSNITQQLSNMRTKMCCCCNDWIFFLN